MKISQNPISPPTLGLKIMKSPPRNQFIKGFLTIPKKTPFFFKKKLILMSFLWQNCSIVFNNSYTTGLLHNTRPPSWTTINWALSNATKGLEEGTMLNGRSQHEKQNKHNKLPSLKDSLV
jgi:hypothetical protein